MESSVIGMFHFGSDSVACRIDLNSKVFEIKEMICDRWISTTPSAMQMYFERDNKENLIETDSEIQSLACFCFLKGQHSVDVFIRKVQSIIVSTCNPSMPSTSTSSSSVISEDSTANSACSMIYEQMCLVKRSTLKSDSWDGILQDVGQIFPDGPDQFKSALRKYSINTSHQWKFDKNDLERVTVFCRNRDSRGCQWRVHASCKNRVPGMFMIKKMEPTHTCGAGHLVFNKPSFACVVCCNKMSKNVFMQVKS